MVRSGDLVDDVRTVFNLRAIASAENNIQLWKEEQTEAEEGDHKQSDVANEINRVRDKVQ